MADSKETYQEIILFHSKFPKNFKHPKNFTHAATVTNPICGDRYTIFLIIKNNVIEEICFEGEGCAISKASCSIMTEYLKGKGISEAQNLIANLRTVLFSETIPGNCTIEKIGEVAALSGVRDYPGRIICATLGWDGVTEAISKGSH